MQIAADMVFAASYLEPVTLPSGEVLDRLFWIDLAGWVLRRKYREHCGVRDDLPMSGQVTP